MGANQPINVLRQAAIQAGHSSKVVSHQRNADPVVDIAPIRVMPHHFSGQSHPGHESKRLRKIGKAKLTPQLSLAELPERQFLLQ